MDPKIFDDLARKLADSVPAGIKDIQADMEKNFHQILQSGFDKLNLVTREEFEVQSAVLQRTREKLEALEKRVNEMEKGEN